jgi:hypothetical protein
VRSIRSTVRIEKLDGTDTLAQMLPDTPVECPADRDG